MSNVIRGAIANNVVPFLSEGVPFVATGLCILSGCLYVSAICGTDETNQQNLLSLFPQCPRDDVAICWNNNAKLIFPVTLGTCCLGLIGFIFSKVISNGRG